MTGDQALQCVELAILRAQAKAGREYPRDENLLNALGAIAAELSEFQTLDAHARKAAAERSLSSCPSTEK